MTTNKVMREIYIEEDDKKFFTDFSPMNGEYSFLFNMDRFIFRGERSERFGKLLPTSLREDNREKICLLGNMFRVSSSSPQKYNFEILQQKAEFNILNIFYKTANYKGLNLPDVSLLRNSKVNLDSPFQLPEETGDIWLPNDFLELAALAQHYGLPTRLIDWSRDIYTALYFASSGALHAIDDESKFMILYALDFFQIKMLEKEIPIRLVIPENYKNPNLNFQRGVLSAWEYKSQHLVLGQSTEVDKDSLFVNRQSLETLMQEYIDKNNITWGFPDTATQEPIIYKFYIPINMSLQIYDYIKKLGYGADRLFNGYEGVSKMMEDDMTYTSKILKNAPNPLVDEGY